jgi:hypothetical protein
MGSLVFDSTTDWIERTANLPATTLCTATCWVKLNSSGAGTARPLFTINNSTDTRSLYIGTGNRLTTLSASYSAVDVTATTPATDEWIYVYIVYNGTTTGSILIGWYNNAGTLVGSTSSASNLDFTPTFMLFGNRRQKDNNAYAKIAYGRVWDAALSSQDIIDEQFSTSVVRTTNFNSGFADSVSGVSPESTRGWTDNNTSFDSDGPLAVGLTPIVMTWTL